MTIGFLVECLVNTEILKNTRDFINTLCGLDLELLDVNAKPIRISSESKGTSFPVNRIFSQNPCRRCLSKFPGCLNKNDQEDFLAHILATKKPEVFTCEKRLKMIFVPIVINSQVIAFLMTGERETLRLDGNQIKSISAFLKKMTDTIIKNELKFFEDFKGSDLNHQQKIVKQVIKDIKENYHLPDLSLQTLSQRNGISYSYLSRMFKKELKTSFAKYRNKVRMDVATKLLKDRSLTIGQISYSCGFVDPGYFCKVFKETFGYPPVDYRGKSVRHRLSSKKLQL